MVKMSDMPAGIRRHALRDGYEVRIRFKDPITGESRRASGYAKTLPEAKKKQRDMISRIEANQRPKDDSITLADWATNWLEVQVPLLELKPNTTDLYKGLLYKHLLSSKLGRMRMSQITPVDVSTFMKELSEVAGQSLLRNVYTVLTHLFRLAIQNSLIIKSPLEHVRRPKQKRQEVRFLTEGELASMLRELQVSRYLSVAELILQTGLRRGEALGLSWDDLDIANQQLHVRYTIDAKGRRGAPKTTRSVRTLDLNIKALAVLRSLRKAQNESKLRLGGFYSECEWNPVFTTDHGKPSQPRVFLRAIQNAAERCGLNNEAHADRVGVHTLRHYVASKLLANGVEMMVVSRILGHESIKTTVDIYGHLQDSQRRQALTSLA
jgi:integrase